MLVFATPGCPRSTPGAGGTIEGLHYAKKLGIDAMEMEWVQSVPKNIEHVARVSETAKNLGMTLTVHAPYFINLNSLEEEKLMASKKRIIDALSMAQVAGAISVCVHAAFYQGAKPDEAYDRVCHAIEDILQHKPRLFPDVNLALETMGKQSQFGTLEEVLRVSKEFGQYPCLDPAHMHARSNGQVNTIQEWQEMMDVYTSYLGKDSLKQMHMHFSGIAYGLKGEKHHLPLEESDARWRDFLVVLKEREVGGVLVCESPLMEIDTLLLKNSYAKL